MFKRQRNGQGDGRQENTAFFFLLFINIGRIGRDLCRIGRMGRIGILSLWYNWILCLTVQ